jgi:hypothetical protein
MPSQRYRECGGVHAVGLIACWAIEKARLNRDPFMTYFRADYKLDSLRSDPRFTELVKRMNMPK